MQTEGYLKLKAELDEAGVALVGVSKTKPPEVIQNFYDQGQRIFGENRVQELTDKHPMLPDDIEWHMIGHLQRNKVKYIVPFIAMIQSVDSLRLLNAIEKEAEKAGRIVDILLQFHIASEDAKYGLDPRQLTELHQQIGQGSYAHVRFRGVMGMATYTDDQEMIRSEFKLLRKTFEVMKHSTFAGSGDFDTISMGMSGDYQIAIEEGSTMVRIGSLVFGARS